MAVEGSGSIAEGSDFLLMEMPNYFLHILTPKPLSNETPDDNGEQVPEHTCLLEVLADIEW